MSTPRAEALTIVPPLIVTLPAPIVSSRTPFAAPFVATVWKASPEPPTVVLATFRAVPVVVVSVFVEPVTLTVPPFVAA
jgi:hypothetical protein